MTTKERKHSAPPRYDEAFKAGAIRMVTEQGRPSREVAKELGICRDTLCNWLKAAEYRLRGKLTRRTGRPNACENWKRKTVRCARNLRRRRRS